MIKLGERCPNDAQAFLSDTQTEVDIVVANRKVRFIETVDRLEYLPSERQAGAGDRRDTAYEVQGAEIAGVRSRCSIVEVARDVTACAEHDTSMLDPTIG